MSKEVGRVSFEIEHYDGSTYIGFVMAVNDDGTVRVFRTLGCSVADIDEDYLFDTPNDLFRIQADIPITRGEYESIKDCYEETEGQS